jgi:hypothetical protein
MMALARPIPKYSLQTLRALDGVVIVVWADGEQVASFWDASFDEAAIQAGDFVAKNLTGRVRQPGS